MMKKISFLVLILIIFSLNVLADEIDYSNNSLITGAATSQPFSLSVTVTNGIPSLNILSPLNSTYLKNTSILLSFTQSGANSVWFNLDNALNLTLSSNSYFFNASQGIHTLKLYANNSDNSLALETVTFNINITRLNIIYDEFRGQGETTEFVDYSLQELGVLYNLTFEDAYGKMYFYDLVNITNINSSDKNTLDFDSNIDIIQNSIYLNATIFPNLNQKAKLSLYGLSFTNPRILLNGVLCSVSICKKISYSGGVLVFNATQMGLFTLEETPQGAVVGPSSGGGGGGSSGNSNTSDNTKTSNFYVNASKYVVKLKQGETKKEYITITNTGRVRAYYNITIEKIADLIKLSQDQISLNPGESKILEIDILASDNLQPKTYIGLFKVTDGTTEEIFGFALDVEKYGALFDVKISIPEEYEFMQPGKTLLSEIKIYNLGKPLRVDASLEYSILYENGDVYLADSEMVAVETQLDMIKKIKLPKDMPDGRYLLNVKVIYGDEVAFSSLWFNVQRIEEPKSNVKFYFIVFFILISFVLYILYKLYIIEKDFRVFAKKKKKKK